MAKDWGGHEEGIKFESQWIERTKEEKEKKMQMEWGCGKPLEKGRMRFIL